MEEKIFRCALVGCGAIAPNHLEALAELDFAEVTALCDIDPERAEAMRARYAPSAKIYTDFKAMLDSEELDSVHIATPHYLHAAMAMAALERNLNVFLEKPMCTGKEEIQALLSAEKKSRGKIAVCFQNRFNATTKLARKIADDDGGALSAFAAVVWQRDENYYTKSPWRGTYKTEGGGVLINQAIHTLDLLCEFLGVPSELSATTANHHLKGVIEVEDSAEGLISFESGKSANFYATTSFAGGDKTYLCIKTKNHEIEISNSEIFVDKIKQSVDFVRNAQVGKTCYGKGHYILIREFYKALLDGADMPVSLESAMWALRILLAVYNSRGEKTKV